jgi:catechol 2,3-dioxygenase-like lactoylglutathione lyase family enzyme
MSARWALVVLLAAGPGGPRQAAAQDRPCGTSAAAIRFDHVTIAVADLEVASSAFRDQLGFSLKPGRTHDNGLRNVHVRFADGSALELMSTGAGQPDELSEWYRRFLDEGDGGAFVALRAGPADAVLQRLGALADDAIVFRGKAFDWVSFPAGHSLHPIFFVSVRSRPADEPDQLKHANGAAGLSEVWVEVSAPGLLADVLGSFGSTVCGRLERPGGRAGLGHGLDGGTLVAVPIEAATGDHRVVGVVVKSELMLAETSANGVWLAWEAFRP